MTYVDAYYDRRKDQIEVVERVNGKRVYKTYPAEHVVYFEHPSGQYKSIFGDPCKRFVTNDNQKFRKEMMRLKGKKTFESDINPIFRCLASNYLGKEAPPLNVCFFDIETDFHPEHGFAPVDDPFNIITSITIYIANVQRLITLAVPPPTITEEEADVIAAKFSDTFIFGDEADMLRTFLDLMDDVDLVSGWNSGLYDIPYIVNRIEHVLGSDETRRLCLWGQKPRKREVEKFKKMHTSFDLVGRAHLDYLDLYQKHNTQQLHSYRLDYVGEIEIGENKTPYSGTLDDLYKKDFEKFIEYNRQDVMILVKIDKKKRLLELHNQLAHQNTVLLKTTMGSVALIEQAIINEINAMGFVAPNRPEREDDGRYDKRKNLSDDTDDDEDDEESDPVVGAYVADPKKGLHEHVACVDINSLYPHVIMALNMSPETIYAQLRPDETMAYIQERVAKLGKQKRAEAWEGVFNCLELDHVFAQDGAPVTVDFEDGRSKVMSGREIHDMIYNPNSNLCITANGTIFKTDKDGIIPLLLQKWYADRKQMQATQAKYALMASGVDVPKDLIELLK